jgi:hypothetical protein
MSDVIDNDELNALAAEYVLGTLDYEERKGASALLEVDPTFRGIVRIWERRFGDLHLMVEAVEPDPQLWVRIKPKMAGVEQVAPAIPSSKMPEEPAAAAAPAEAALAEAAPATEAAPPTVPAAEDAAAETTPETKPEAVTADATAPATTEAAPATTPAAETPPAEAKLDESKPDESKPDESKPAEVKPAAVAEAELKLAELAALLPVTGGAGGAASAHTSEPLPEDGLHTHAPDLVPRGFVPPVPMSTRGTPAVVEKTVHKPGGRGWMAATLTMALIAVALAGLISAWRFFPDRLPAQLRANTVLNLTSQAAQPAPKAVARPKLAPFDE